MNPQLKKNIDEVRKQINEAALKSGRKPEDITLIAVTKTVDVDTIRDGIELGLEHLGENRVQEFDEKYNQIGDACKWHLIGHLQTNKVKSVVGRTELIHSVDSIRLAMEIDRQSKRLNVISKILIEINIAMEETKFGILPNHVKEFVKSLEDCENIMINGFMCVAPFVEKSEQNRKYFRKMCEINVDNKNMFQHNTSMLNLSMGMSNDFAVAIEEGATMVRIGTSLFGSR